MVDELVADGDGVDGGPVGARVFGGGDDGLEVLLEGVDVEEAGEDLFVGLLGGGEDGGYLVAVHAVDADEGIFGQELKVGIDFLLVLAAPVVVVGGVADPKTAWIVPRGRSRGGGGGG